MNVAQGASVNARPNAAPNLAEVKLRQILGDLIVQNTILSTQVEELTKEVAELKNGQAKEPVPPA